MHAKVGLRLAEEAGVFANFTPEMEQQVGRCVGHGGDKLSARVSLGVGLAALGGGTIYPTIRLSCRPLRVPSRCLHGIASLTAAARHAIAPPQARALFERMILATDMAHHHQLLARFAAAAEAYPDAAHWAQDKRQLLLELALHAADLSNPARPFTLAAAFGVGVARENLAQGAAEAAAKLAVSKACDAARIDLPACQIFFITAFAKVRRCRAPVAALAAARSIAPSHVRRFAHFYAHSQSQPNPSPLSRSPVRSRWWRPSRCLRRRLDPRRWRPWRAPSCAGSTSSR